MSKLPGEGLHVVAFDTETHLFQPGLRAPHLVVGSSATEAPGSERLHTKDETRALFRAILEDPTKALGGANIPYDLCVLMADNPDLTGLVFKAVEENRIIDTHILEALHDNGRGCMFREVGGAPFHRYSLQILEARYLGIDRTAEKKGENAWRLKYATLENIPLAQWPQDAIDYPRRDARYTFDVLAHQLGRQVAGYEEAPPRLNLQCHAQEIRAALALNLASVWGMRTDPVMVSKVVGDIKAEHERSRRQFFDAGIVRVRPCNKKDGEYEKADDITAEWLDQAVVRLLSEGGKAVDRGPWVTGRLKDIEKAKKALAKGRPIRFATDKGRLMALVESAYQGSPPLTDGGESGNRQTSTSRDTLIESDDPLLEEYGEDGENEKLFSTFSEVLESGTRVPINPEANTLVKTQRTSYSKPNLQQLPRKGMLRNCFIPRPGNCYVSCDYSALELCTLAQVCYTLFGASVMRDAINAGQDLHTRLAARLAGVTYEEGMALRAAKDPVITNLRQAAKPVNFGLPGLMGPPKLVATARKDGVRFCELAAVSEVCGENRRIVKYKGREIAPTCCECLSLASDYQGVWYAEWPEMRAYHDATIAQAKECFEGTPLESFGTGMLRLEENASAVSNHFFQNLAAQGAKHALWLIQKEAYTDRCSVLYNNQRTVVFVHDENFGEVREGVLHEGGHRVAELMVSGMREFTPDVLITVEPAACRRWFKGADKVLNTEGRLVPWWPGPERLDKGGEKIGWGWGPDQEQMRADMRTYQPKYLPKDLPGGWL